MAAGRAVDPTLERSAGAAPRTATRLALAAIVAVAGLLRFSDLGSVPLNPYYDAAVRSMGTSWHAFLYGAFEPGVSVATDKPPLDLWLQVAATKVLGFTPFALHLPQAVASMVAIVLLYDLVRRGFGVLAGLVAAAALALLPADVLTARSDTMDSVMAALLVFAAWLIIRAAERGRGRELYLAGVVVGLAFEAKLFEALVPVPALVLMYLLADRGPWRRRVGRLALAGGVAAVVALAWPAFVALTPAADRPYPMGSANGSIWDVVFSYDGLGRLASTTEYRHANPPGMARLLIGGEGADVGVELVLAAAFALVAIAVGAVAARRGALSAAIGAGVALWTLLAVIVLSAMGSLNLRYLETLTPALAAVFGIGAAGCALVIAGRGRQRTPVRAAAAALLLAAALAVPTARSIALVGSGASDGGRLGHLPAMDTTALSHYLTAHRDGARYEFAALDAADASTLIAADAQPVLILAGTPYHPLVSVSGLARAVAAGEVRYILVSDRSTPCGDAVAPPHLAWKARMVAWIRDHGTDVTQQAGLRGCGVLMRVTGA